MGRWESAAVRRDCHVAGGASMEPERKILGWSVV